MLAIKIFIKSIIILIIFINNVDTQMTYWERTVFLRRKRKIKENICKIMWL